MKLSSSKDRKRFRVRNKAKRVSSTRERFRLSMSQDLAKNISCTNN